MVFAKNRIPAMYPNESVDGMNIKKNPLILFITSATSSTGAGHMMRCLAYAKNLRSLGCETFFDSIVEIPWLKNFMDTQGFSIHESPAVEYDLVILDSYDLTFLQQRLTQHSYRKSLQICDSSTPIMDVDGVIWLDPQPPQSVGSGEKTKVLASGVTYLMQEMLCQRISPPLLAKNVLVVLGGSPSRLVIDEVVKLLGSTEFRSVAFHILSDYIPSKTTTNGNLFFYSLGTDMVPLLNICDTIITSAGTSLWVQFSNLRVMGVISVVENQQSNYQYVVDRDLACGLGFFEKDSFFTDKTSLEKLLFESDFRNQMFLRMNSFVDNKGGQRLAAVISAFVFE